MQFEDTNSFNTHQNDHYFQRVYDVTCLIPRGSVTTYGAIADFLGLGSARMVGWALNHSHVYHTYIPAHRVVNRKGELSGRHHFNPPEKMATLLLADGIPVKNDRITDFEKYFWHPRMLEQL